MTDASSIGAPEVRRRLHDSWRVSNDGETVVYGYARGHADPDFPMPVEIPASFGIRKTDDLWTATWQEPNEASGHHELADQAEGTKERCIEWVVERANNLREKDD